MAQTTEPAPGNPPDDAPTTAMAREPAAAAAGPGAAPRLCDGIELVGRFEGSGFKEPPFIARRSDGQMVQMPPMLYSLAELVDGKTAEDELARKFSNSIERQVEPDMVRTLLDEQLRPLGVVAPADGSDLELKKADPLDALRFRTKVVPASLVHALTTVFRPLFLPPVVVAVVLAFIGLDVWLFGIHGISQGIRHVLYDPALIFLLFGGIVLATTFHEIGHATGTRYGGARPGVMGVGIYIVWPAFYTDITDSYRLGKAGRLRADLGGMYFNAVFALAVAGLYALTGFEPLILLIVLQTFAIIQQSLPLLRLDGFYIISDLTGVPDMLTRIKPILQSLIPGRDPDARVTELKPWTRRVVTGYVLTVVPLIALLFVVMLVHAPRAFATGYDSFLLHAERGGATDILQMVVLALPLIGMVYTATRVGGRVGAGAWSWSGGRPARRAGVLAAGTAAAAALAFLWWPNTDDYRPIQPGEKGTLVSAVRSLPRVPTGRAALTPERQRELGGAPFRKDSEKTRTRDKPAATQEPAPTSTTETSTTEEPAATTTVPAETVPADTTTAPAEPVPPTETAPAPAPTETTTTTP
jgi:putative peptide zinc metalloprotease protein